MPASCKQLLINTLWTTKSFGPDKIPIWLLKDCKEVITPYLTYIFNKSLTFGTFPDDWKNARVSPMYKSETKDDRGNYRPISLLLYKHRHSTTILGRKLDKLYLV